MTEFRERLEVAFADQRIDGPCRLHWSNDDNEPEKFQTFDDLLDEVEKEALDVGLSPEEVERIAYVISEDDYLADQEE